MFVFFELLYTVHEEWILKYILKRVLWWRFKVHSFVFFFLYFCFVLWFKGSDHVSEGFGNLGTFWLSCKSSLITSYMEHSGPPHTPSPWRALPRIGPLLWGSCIWLDKNEGKSAQDLLTDWHGKRKGGQLVGVLHCPYMETQREGKQRFVQQPITYTQQMKCVCVSEGDGWSLYLV